MERVLTRLLTKSVPFTFNRAGYYYFSRRVPADLVQHYSHPRIVHGLKTRSAQTAKSRASVAQGLTPTPSSATSELPRQYDLIRVVAFSLTLLAAKLLAYITGYSFTSNDKYKVSYLWHGVMLTEATSSFLGSIFRLPTSFFRAVASVARWLTQLLSTLSKGYPNFSSCS